MPAAFERAGCSLAIPFPKTFALAFEEARTSTVREAIPFTEGLADALSHGIAESGFHSETFPDTQAFSDAQTLSAIEARRRVGQCRG